jgi:hypothetical protein
MVFLVLGDLCICIHGGEIEECGNNGRTGREKRQIAKDKEFSEDPLLIFAFSLGIHINKPIRSINNIHPHHESQVTGSDTEHLVPHHPDHPWVYRSDNYTW